MTQHSAAARATSEGNSVDARFQTERSVATRGNSLSLRCLNDAIDASGVPHKVLAAEVDQQPDQFSKSLNGARGGDFNGVLDNIRSAIRLDYARRMAEAERQGGLEDLAAEALAHAAIHFLATRRKRPAKAQV